MLAATVPISLLTPHSAEARRLFETEIELLGLVASTSSNSVRNVPDFYSSDRLPVLFEPWDPGIDPLPPIEADLDLRGLEMRIEFVENETELLVEIPGFISTVFGSSAGSRDEALEEFEAWLRSTADAVQTAQPEQLLRALVRLSPVDPVAGNPNSLMSKMADADWRAMMRPPHERGDRDGPGVPNTFSMMPSVSYASACIRGCIDVTSVDLPLAYDFNLDALPLSFYLDLPVAVTFTNGQWSLIASAGAGLRYRVRDGWSLTAGFRSGATGSLDVGALAFMFSVSAGNRMEREVGSLRVGMGNQVMVIGTYDDIEVSGVAVDYDLLDVVFRNGLDVGGDLGRRLRWSFGGDYSHYFGSDLWARDMGQVGATLHVLRSIGGRRYDRARLWLGYFGARSYSGVRVDIEVLF